VCENEFEPFIEGAYEELARYLNAYDQKMFMKRENIADRGIWTAKKRYILNVWDSEGVRYEEPKLKMMGIEAVKSSTPAPCRDMIKDALKIMMNGTEDEIIDFIDQSRKDFRKLPPEDIAFPRSVSNVKKYKSEVRDKHGNAILSLSNQDSESFVTSCKDKIYNKGTPIHARGALLFNYYIEKEKLTYKYSLIQDGDKIKFCYLKEPNSIQENVISFLNDFPRELGLDSYVDYDLQFEKSFLEPLKIILDSMGWNLEKTVNLELFFG
jgi:DNA polymerase elongation subunit (family B)